MQVAKTTSSEPSLISRVKLLAQLIGISQKDLALNLGLKPSQMNLYFNEKAEMKANRFVDLLKVLGVDVETLLEEKIRSLQSSSEIDDATLHAKLGRVTGRKKKSLLKIIKILGD